MIIKLQDIEEIEHGNGLKGPLAINGDHVISIGQEVKQEDSSVAGRTERIVYALFAMSHGEDIRIRIGSLDDIQGGTKTPVWLTNLLVAFNK